MADLLDIRLIGDGRQLLIFVFVKSDIRFFPLILIGSIWSCQKEKLISINPFDSLFSPSVTDENQTARFNVQLTWIQYGLKVRL